MHLHGLRPPPRSSALVGAVLLVASVFGLGRVGWRLVTWQRWQGDACPLGLPPFETPPVPIDMFHNGFHRFPIRVSCSYPTPYDDRLGWNITFGWEYNWILPFLVATFIASLVLIRMSKRNTRGME